MPPRPDPTPEPSEPAPTIGTIELLGERLRRLLLMQDDADRLHATVTAQRRLIRQQVNECRTALELTQNPTRGM